MGEACLLSERMQTPAANGASASASSTYGGQPLAAKTINGDHVGSNGWWADDTSLGYPDWLEIDFSGSKTINEIDVFGLQQNYSSPVEPSLTLTSSYALTNFEVQYWNGNAWATVPVGSVSGNDKVWRKFTFARLTTSKIRVYVTNVAGDNRSQVVEVEAYNVTGPTIQWLVPDQLGTPRMMVDQSGKLGHVTHHDYLPFGEELFAGTGGRSPSLGYGSGDKVRQQFTAKERDVETGLDYFGARYYGNLLGRFTSADPLIASGRASLPQSWNRYAYALNSPLRLIDPDGLMERDSKEEEEKKRKEQHQPAQTPQSSLSQPAGAPQTPTGLKVVVAIEANTMRNFEFGGSLFTGVGALLALTPTDQNGDAIRNVTVIESVSPNDTIQNPNPVTSPTGTIGDLVGTGERHPATQRKSIEEAGAIIVPRPDTPRIITQTHTMSIFSPTSGIMAIATHTRTLTNVDRDGNLVNNVRGNRKVNNYRITDISSVTVVQKPMVMCPRF